MKQTKKVATGSLYEFKTCPPIGQIIPLSLQHVAACIVGLIAPALMVAQICNLTIESTSLLVQTSLLVSGLATLLQLFPIGRAGAKLPVVVGVSFAYVPITLSIAGQFGIATVMGSILCGGIVAIVAGLFLKQIRHLFPPLVSGTVIFTIGLSLYNTGVTYMAGGGNVQNNPNFGSWQNWLVAVATLVIVTFFTYFTKGLSKLASILIGILCGCALSAVLGMVDVSSVASAGWFQAPRPLHFGLKFEASAIISMSLMFVINSVQAIGDFTSVTLNVFNRDATDKELSGGIISNGIMGIAAALLGCPPCGTYSQNVGIISATKVVNRLVFTGTAVVFIAAGLIPKFSALLCAIPQSVIGGATISVFSSIAMGGIRMIEIDKLNLRNILIVGLSVALGLGVTSVSGALAGFPAWVNTLFGTSPVVLSAIAATVLNLTLPKDNSDEPEILMYP